MEMMDNLEMENPCIYCGRKNLKSIGWIKAENQFTCGCGTVISVNMKQFNNLMAEGAGSLAGFKNTL